MGLPWNNLEPAVACVRQRRLPLTEAPTAGSQAGAPLTAEKIKKRKKKKKVQVSKADTVSLCQTEAAIMEAVHHASPSLFVRSHVSLLSYHTVLRGHIQLGSRDVLQHFQINSLLLYSTYWRSIA